MRAVRGRRIGFVFQEPMTALDPVFTIGYQIAETLPCTAWRVAPAARSRAVEMLDAVRVPDAARRAREYPHQLRGGLRQRAMIALALAAEPALVIADEPTTALDVTVQAEMLDLLREMRAAFDLSLLLITHDLGVVAEMADRVAVMYAGRIVEHGAGARRVRGAAASVYARPAGLDAGRTAGGRASRDPRRRAGARRTCPPAARSPTMPRSVRAVHVGSAARLQRRAWTTRRAATSTTAIAAASPSNDLRSDAPR